MIIALQVLPLVYQVGMPKNEDARTAGSSLPSCRGSGLKLAIHRTTAYGGSQCPEKWMMSIEYGAVVTKDLQGVFALLILRVSRGYRQAVVEVPHPVFFFRRSARWREMSHYRRALLPPHLKDR